MDWKREAIDKLRSYAARNAALDNIPEEIKAVASRTEDIRSSLSDEVSVKGGGRRHDDPIINNVVMKNELAKNLRETKMFVNNINRALNVLTKDELLVLQRFYIYPERGAVAHLCEELGREQPTVYRLRDRALRRFTMALYGIGDSF